MGDGLTKEQTGWLVDTFIAEAEAVRAERRARGEPELSSREVVREAGKRVRARVMSVVLADGEE